MSSIELALLECRFWFLCFGNKPSHMRVSVGFAPQGMAVAFRVLALFAQFSQLVVGILRIVKTIFPKMVAFASAAFTCLLMSIRRSVLLFVVELILFVVLLPRLGLVVVSFLGAIAFTVSTLFGLVASHPCSGFGFLLLHEGLDGFDRRRTNVVVAIARKSILP